MRFSISNGTKVDAVYCKDLYADLIEGADQSDSERAKFIANIYQNSHYICPNLTSFDFLDKETHFVAKISKCNTKHLTSYAGDTPCNDELS